MTSTALITGASRGLGLALARELAQQGWTLIINARGVDALETARAELAQHTRVIAIAGDVTDAEHRQALADAVRSVGGLDVLVNNASILGPSPQPELLHYPLEILEQVYRTNVIAPLALLQAVAADLRPNARILNITSDAGVEAYPGWGGYGSSKAALEHLSRILAAEKPDLRQGSLPENMVKTKTSRKNFELDAPEPAENVMLNETTWQLRERAKRGEVTDAELAKIASFVQTLPESESAVVEVSARLAQLKEAYTAGLLTDEQYSRKRTEILNDL